MSSEEIDNNSEVDGVDEDIEDTRDCDGSVAAPPATECTAYRNIDDYAVLPIIIPRHPRAEKIQSEFDPSKKISDCSYTDKAYFDNSYSDVVYLPFFNTAPVSRNIEYSGLYNNIRMYALHRLIQGGKISLTAFDSSAALTNLCVSADGSTIAVPFEGAFVLTLENDVEVILHLDRYSGITNWRCLGASFADIVRLDKMLTTSIKNHNLYQDKVFTQGGEFIKLPKATLDDIYLDENLRKEIHSNIFNYFNPTTLELKRKNGVPTKRGIIFAGTPGTGKTFLSRVIANSLPSTFMVITNISLVSELNFCMKFMAQFSNSVILFEDIDLYLPDRSLGPALLSTMLNYLDGIAVNEHLLILCTTNDPESLDKAMKNRPGRFDRTLQFDPPDTILKGIMLKAFCSKNDCIAVDFEKVISALPTEYTGAHLKELYITTVIIALENNCLDDNSIAKLSTDFFMTAFKQMSIHHKGKKRLGFSGENE